MPVCSTASPLVFVSLSLRSSLVRVSLLSMLFSLCCLCCTLSWWCGCGLSLSRSRSLWCVAAACPCPLCCRVVCCVAVVSRSLSPLCSALRVALSVVCLFLSRFSSRIVYARSLGSHARRSSVSACAAAPSILHGRFAPDHSFRRSCSSSIGNQTYTSKVSVFKQFRTVSSARAPAERATEAKFKCCNV